MFFEAKIKGKNVNIEIKESPDEWTLSFSEPGKNNTEVHSVKKWDYQTIDDAISFLFENISYMISVVGEGTKYSVYTRGSYREIPLFNEETLLHESLKGGGSIKGGDSLTAGMPGKIVEVLVKEGDKVEENQPILIMEAMKMENEMRASHATTIKEVKVEKGQSVESGAVLIVYGDE